MGFRDSPRSSNLAQEPFLTESPCSSLYPDFYSLVPLNALPSPTVSPSQARSAHLSGLWSIPVSSGHVLSASFMFPLGDASHSSHQGLIQAVIPQSQLQVPPQHPSRLKPPSQAPPTSSPQVLSLHPNSDRNLNGSQMKTQEKNVSTLVQSTPGPGEWVCICRLPIPPRPTPTPPCGSTFSAGQDHSSHTLSSCQSQSSFLWKVRPGQRSALVRLGCS